jgi:hypothetical protein
MDMKFRNCAITLASLALPFAAAAAAQPASSQPTSPRPMNQPAPPAGQPPASAGQTQPAQPGTPATGQAQPGRTGATAAATNAATALATAADLKAGTAVYDQNGGSVGTVDSADASGAVISTGKARVKIPMSGIGKNARGLVVAMTKDQLEAAAAAASAKPAG